ncbi:class I SAM-dependent methyltransferase [Marinirhabdus gelatinilytica]|uniref:Methyltransferase family protein n=1 Tax=Marinirhabdus gelatinilytica TaxID=1703343 RepID=A0A370QAT5_9FLAO|nr:class I SAM-dependent methyltransferase [Marinirhabdus gelatinilytica]RDK85491.1 methyltransferase family protein [Marinirhabdus gelatinilytica]
MGLRSKFKKYRLHKRLPMPTYQPKKYSKPENMIEVVTAWAGLEEIVEDILDTFNIGRERCIEFGVEFGYSSVVFSNYFKKVTGVDIFVGDEHTDFKGDHYQETKERLQDFENITLVKADYKDWIKKDDSTYDFSHVDIVHNYAETYECGLWAAQHSTCTIFHDTESFPEVRRAVIDIAKATGKRVYNYPNCNGLGIVV